MNILVQKETAKARVCNELVPISNGPNEVCFSIRFIFDSITLDFPMYPLHTSSPKQ